MEDGEFVAKTQELNMGVQEIRSEKLKIDKHVQVTTITTNH